MLLARFCLGVGSEGPAFAVFFGDVFLGVGVIGAGGGGGVVVEFFAEAIGDIAEEDGFGEGGGVGEVAGGWGVVFAGFDPLVVVADGGGDGLVWRLEVFELVMGEEDTAAVIGEEHAFVADEEGSCAPLVGEFEVDELLGAFVAVVPGEVDGLAVGGSGVVVIDDEPFGARLGVGFWALGVDGGGVAEVEGPMGEVHMVAGHIGECSAAEIPPAAPGEGVVGGVVGSEGSGSDPEIPVEALG